jgi:hypothetical protein
MIRFRPHGSTSHVLQVSNVRFGIYEHELTFCRWIHHILLPGDMGKRSGNEEEFWNSGSYMLFRLLTYRLHATVW